MRKVILIFALSNCGFCVYVVIVCGLMSTGKNCSDQGMSTGWIILAETTLSFASLHFLANPQAGKVLHKMAGIIFLAWTKVYEMAKGVRDSRF